MEEQTKSHIWIKASADLDVACLRRLFLWFSKLLQCDIFKYAKLFVVTAWSLRSFYSIDYEIFAVNIFGIYLFIFCNILRLFGSLMENMFMYLQLSNLPSAPLSPAKFTVCIGYGPNVFSYGTPARVIGR